MLYPSIKTLVSSVNKIENISFETLLRSLIYIMNRSGPSTEPWRSPQSDYFGLRFFCSQEIQIVFCGQDNF